MSTSDPDWSEYFSINEGQKRFENTVLKLCLVLQQTIALTLRGIEIVWTLTRLRFGSHWNCWPTLERKGSFDSSHKLAENFTWSQQSREPQEFGLFNSFLSNFTSNEQNLCSSFS